MSTNTLYYSFIFWSDLTVSSLKDCTHIFIKSMFQGRYFFPYNYIIIFVGECRQWYWQVFFPKVSKALTLSRNNWNTFYTLEPFPYMIPCMSCNWQFHSFNFLKDFTFLWILTPSFGSESIVDQLLPCSLLKACCSFSFLSASWTNKITWHCREEEYFNTLDQLMLIWIICLCPLQYKGNQMTKSVIHLSRWEQF